MGDVNSDFTLKVSCSSQSRRDNWVYFNTKLGEHTDKAKRLALRWEFWIISLPNYGWYSASYWSPNKGSTLLDKVDSDQLRAIIEADPLTTAPEVSPRTQHWPFDSPSAFETIGKVIKLDKPRELTEIKKISILKCCLLLFYATTVNCFSIRLWHVMKSGFYMTTNND